MNQRNVFEIVEHIPKGTNLVSLQMGNSNTNMTKYGQDHKT